MFIYDEVFNQYSRTIDIFEKVVKPNLLESLFKGKNEKKTFHLFKKRRFINREGTIMYF